MAGEELAIVAKLTIEVRRLEDELALMRRRHLQFVCMIVHAMGGEMRLTREDFVAVPPGCELHQRIDAATGDMLYKTTVPEKVEP